MLGLGDGPGSDELDDVADLELIVRVVRLVLLLDALPPVVFRVRGQPHHLHPDSLVRLGRHHASRQLLRRRDPPDHPRHCRCHGRRIWGWEMERGEEGRGQQHLLLLLPCVLLLLLEEGGDKVIELQPRLY